MASTEILGTHVLDEQDDLHLEFSVSSNIHITSYKIEGSKNALVKALFALSIKHEFFATALTETMDLLSDGDFVAEMKAEASHEGGH
ncbi:hypothetical protein [Runella zeae]|uniref:hypothetical protein n=1 Tax=Runella zeae TaxID=94255 RepID=UPI000416A771|nr:hypothetical protein [Runella zeae]